MKAHLFRLAIVAAGCLVGVDFASFLVSLGGLMGRYTIADAVRDWIILSLGALAGGVVFSWASKR